MLIIVLKDKCDFNIHAYWFIFSSHIWKNSKEIPFFYAVSFQFLYEIPNRWRQVLLAKWFCWLCCRVLFLKGKNVVLNAWISSYFILMYFDVKVKKNHSQIIAFCKNTHKQKIIYHIWNEIGAEFTSWFMHIVFDIENEFLLILPLLTGFF